MCHRVRMYRAVGRCSARMRQRPRQVFLFPLPSLARSKQRHGRTDRTRLKNTQSSPRTGRGQSFVLLALAPLSRLLFPTFVRPAAALVFLQEDLSCFVLHADAAAAAAAAAAANTPTPRTTNARRGSTAPGLPNKLPNLCTSQHSHLLNCSARRAVPFHAQPSCGIPAFWQANYPRVAVGLQFVGQGEERQNCVGAVPSYYNTTLPTRHQLASSLSLLTPWRKPNLLQSPESHL